jgi:hypothetical protein
MMADIIISEEGSRTAAVCPIPACCACFPSVAHTTATETVWDPLLTRETVYPAACATRFSGEAKSRMSKFETQGCNKRNKLETEGCNERNKQPLPLP